VIGEAEAVRRCPATGDEEDKTRRHEDTKKKADNKDFTDYTDCRRPF
jgi:hypothetical protein